MRRALTSSSSPSRPAPPSGGGGISPQCLGIAVDRNGQPARENTTTRATCTTI